MQDKTFTNNKGSEWKKWDLHIHTPFSKDAYDNQNNDETWERFIIELEESDIDVIGINDYWVIEGYKKVLKYKSKDRLKDKIIFPVIEYRVDKFTSLKDNWKYLNLHILFSNELTIINIQDILDQINQCDNILFSTQQKLDQQNQDELSIPLDDTISQLSTKPTLSNFKGKWLLAFGHHEWSCIHTNNKCAEQTKILNKCDFLLGNINTHIDKKSLYIQQICPNKPLFIFSDKHDFKETDNSGHCNDFSQFTWIKANSFEGFKIALKEPDRISFSKENPYAINNKQYLVQNINLINQTDCFANTKKLIKFNQDLVSIIGNKGAGKSVLGSMIVNCFNENISEISQYKDILSDNFPTVETLNKNNILEHIQYFSQKKINSLTDIHNVIELNHLLVRITSSYSDNPDIIHYDKYKQSIRELDKQYQDELNQINVYFISNKDIEKKLKEIKDKIENITASIKVNDENHALLTKQHDNNSDYKKYISLKGEVEKLKEKESCYTNVNNKFSMMKSKISSFEEVIQQQFREPIKILIEDIQKLNNEIDISSDKFKVDYPVNTLHQEIDKQIAEIEKQITENNLTISIKEKELEALQDKLGEIASKAYLEELRYSKLMLKQQLTDKTKELEELKKTKNLLDNKKAKRKTLFINYLTEQLNIKDSLDKITKNIEDYIKKLCKNIDSNDLRTELHKIKFNIKLSDTQKNYLNEIDDLIDNRSNHSQLHNDVKGVVNNYLNSDLNTSNLIEMYDKLEQYLDEFNCEELRQGVSELKLYNQIFQFSIQWEYDLTYNNTQFSKLSEGQKGTSLLLLILLLDKDSKDKILIIDQPEDQLDNATVNNILVPAFKIAKQKRQIFMITHNANLVVNGDSDQVIVAQDLRTDHKLYIEYTIGSLEDITIKKYICTILEGGEEAFNKRREKYNL